MFYFIIDKFKRKNYRLPLCVEKSQTVVDIGPEAKPITLVGYASGAVYLISSESG